MPKKAKYSDILPDPKLPRSTKDGFDFGRFAFAPFPFQDEIATALRALRIMANQRLFCQFDVIVTPGRPAWQSRAGRTASASRLSLLLKQEKLAARSAKTFPDKSTSCLRYMGLFFDFWENPPPQGQKTDLQYRPPRLTSESLISFPHRDMNRTIINAL